MEAVSFDDTLGELQKVSSEKMYEVIADLCRRLQSYRTTRVYTKYKTVDRKVRLVATPLPEGSELRMKGVASDPFYEIRPA